MRVSQPRAQQGTHLSDKDAAEIVADLLEVERLLPYHPLDKSEYDTNELETLKEELRTEIVARLTGAHPDQIDWG